VTAPFSPYFLLSRGRGIQDFLHTAHRAVGETDLDAMRVIGRIGEDVLDDSLGKFPRTLILLQDDAHSRSPLDFFPDRAIHGLILHSMMDGRKESTQSEVHGWSWRT
jgi:hypothetical protein